jgi:hypothetical protein
MLEHLEKYGLRHIPRVLRVPKHPQSGVEDGLLVAHDQLVEGPEVSVPAPPHQYSVIVLFHKYRAERKRLVGPVA